MKMTRELQRKMRSYKALTEAVIRREARSLGCKQIAGFTYKVRGEMIVWLDLIPAFTDEDQIRLRATVYVKSRALDPIFWEILGIADETAGKPVSFHVNGAFVTDFYRTGLIELPIEGELTEEQAARALAAANDMAENALEVFPDTAAFEELLDSRALEGREADCRTEKLLCRIFAGDLTGALDLAQRSLDEGSRHFTLTEQGEKSFMEQAAQWCSEKLEGTP
ncbi:MAG: hypothetical protein IJ071_07270 [Ruminococcus sp.]|nr:hypothetical protein [Ruminococcus sp.]